MHERPPSYEFHRPAGYEGCPRGPTDRSDTDRRTLEGDRIAYIHYVGGVSLRMNVHSAMAFFHLIFAAVWTGSVLFVTWGVLPVARDGSIGASTLESILDRLLVVSRASAVVLLVSGGLMASRYGGELTTTTAGTLVLGMTALWLLLIGFVKLAGRTLKEGLETGDAASAVAQSRGRFGAAGVVALLLLIDAGLLSAV